MGTWWRRGHGGSSTRRPSTRIETVVVRDAGRWSLTPLGDQSIHEITIDDLHRFTGRARPGSAPPLDPMTLVTAVDPLVMPVIDGRLCAIAPGGREQRSIDADALRVLDAVVGHIRCTDVATTTGLDPDVVGRVAAALVEAGCLDLVVPVDEIVVAPITSFVEFVPPDDPTIPYLGANPADDAPRPLGTGALAPFDPDRIPVLGVHHPRFGPPLALGMINAYARAWDGGRLEGTFEFRPPVTHDEARLLLSEHTGPAILLCSNYVWSWVDNLTLATELAAVHPELLVVHGGPHTPKYEADQEHFFENAGVHVAVVGEGEQTAVELFDALARSQGLHDRSHLAGVAGLVYRDDTGDLKRTGDRDRIEDLDVLPSPYLTGEFDDIHPGSWSPELGTIAVTETNRGCPYKCTYCDWGSATMSRIRKFSMDRVLGEFEWLADRGVRLWMVADANFGILPRDVQIAHEIAAIRRRTGVPDVWGLNTAKNSTKHLTEIISTLCDAHITAVSSLALQTRDPQTLEAIDRANISAERYDDLALTFRQRRLPILCDLIVGLPGATLESFRNDLQWCFDHGITPRAWICQVLPNAPMNAPEYRERFELDIDDEGIVMASSSFSREERREMMRLRMAERTFEHFGVARHLLRYLQWDHGIPAMEALHQLVRATDAAPSEWPLLSWTLNHLDGFLVPPVSWTLLYDELERFVVDQLHVPRGPALDTVVAVQLACMPDRRARFPRTVDLPHSYVDYYREATAALQRTGRPEPPARRLDSYPPSTFTVRSDPARRCVDTFKRYWAERPSDLLPGEFWHVSHFELDSPLTRWVAEVCATPGYIPDEDLPEPEPLEQAPDPTDAGGSDPRGVPIAIGPRRQ